MSDLSVHLSKTQDLLDEVESLKADLAHYKSEAALYKNRWNAAREASKGVSENNTELRKQVREYVKLKEHIKKIL